MKFSEFPLCPEVLSALSEMGFETLSPIQELAMPKLLNSTDFLGQAPTGTGKTAAFGIPLINRLPQSDDGKIRALVLVPTRELARQVAEELNLIGKNKGIKSIAILGGTNLRQQQRQLREENFDIVVGTPGRVLDLVDRVSLDLATTRFVVLDEADEMLDMGFRFDLEKILKSTPMGRETWLFSATMSKELRKIADDYMYYPEEVRIAPQGSSNRNIVQSYFNVKNVGKADLVSKFLKATPDFYGIIFCQTKKEVWDLTRDLKRKGHMVSCLNGDMEQRDRDIAMERFRSGELQVIVATDVAARGLDVSDLTHIINYQPPRDPESYIHRIGRTARNGKTGIAFTLVDPAEFPDLQLLMRRAEMPIERNADSAPDPDPSTIPARTGRGGGRSGRSGGSRQGGRGGSGGRPQRSPAPKPAIQTGESATEATGGEGQPAKPKRSRNRRRRGPRKPEGQTAPVSMEA